MSSAVAMLRKRFPPLEELRLDEEVATYTFAPVQPTSGFAPVRPRCGNPLASVLHFEESTVSCTCIENVFEGHQNFTQLQLLSLKYLSVNLSFLFPKVQLHKAFEQNRNYLVV